MQNATKEVDRDRRPADVNFSTLRSLGLDQQQLNLLKGQGYLERDKRSLAHAGYWRLRFRQDGSLRTIYLGNESETVDQVRRELDKLQSPCRRRRELQRAVRRGNQIVRGVKLRLMPFLGQFGVHFHGDALRKIRSRMSIQKSYSAERKH
jgi:hypothetical protein